MKKIAILGSTGSIGTQTLEIVRTNGDLEVTALAAGNNIDLLEQQLRAACGTWRSRSYQAWTGCFQWRLCRSQRSW